MSASAIESRLQFHLALWYGVMATIVFFLAIIMAANLFLVAFALMGMGWLISLPYHGRISVVLCLASFQSAIIVPGMPGRPYLWEMAALLAWTGLAIAISLRRYPPDSAEVLRRNKWVFIGIGLHCVSLLVVMAVRGFGLRILGNSAAGGRLYIQQLIVAVFPLLLVLTKLDERTVLRLFLLQLALSLTYIVSDLAFSVFPGALQPLLYVFELSTDAGNFERQAEHFGIRRFQSFGIAGASMIYLLLVFNSVKGFFGNRAVWLWPAMIGLGGAILVSGHRSFVLMPLAVLFVLAAVQGFFNAKNIIMGLMAGALVIVAVYGFVPQMPRAMQRAFSFLPGLNVDATVRSDAETTWMVRKELARLGWRMIPDYLWIGKGFTKYLDRRQYRFEYAVQFHLDQNKFYNGFIGLMVGTGVLGTVGIMILTAGGLILVVRIFRHAQAYGYDDNFTRAAVVAASIWLVDMVFFYFLNGSAAKSLSRFAMQIGLLIVFDRLLGYRRAAAGQLPEPTDEAAPTAQATGQ